jgi:uncharacterized protein with PIN domain
MKFLCDRNLGKLAKWLRILGYDTLYEATDRGFVHQAAQGQRIALTRRRQPVGAAAGRLLVLEADRADRQIAELVEALSLKPDPANRMTRCLSCNERLCPVAGAEVEQAVPAYVCQTVANFKKCPGCGRIYWPGTHGRHVEQHLARLFQDGRQVKDDGEGPESAKA